MKKHSKHTALTKPEGGQYHRNEWAIIGAPCDLIKDLAKDINAQLQSQLKIGYLDADHKSGRRRDKYSLIHTDKISYQSIALDIAPGDKQHRKWYNHLDLLLINGNHFIGAKQIVCLHEKKKESLSRKIDRLSDIRIILLEQSSDEIYDFVVDLIKDKTDVQVFLRSQVEKISNAILKECIEYTPPLFGLILAGGKSQRMGEDKGAIEYHGKAQREYEADLSSKYCHQTFISCRKNQDDLIESKYQKIYDTFEGLGPYGGILSAFRAHPNHAWLTLACDLPFLNKNTLKQLIDNRNPTKLATCFHNPETAFPEPLITIWEPRAYPVLLEFLSQGYSCPRKVLINTDIEELKINDTSQLVNANNMEERNAAISQLEIQSK